MAVVHARYLAGHQIPLLECASVSDVKCKIAVRHESYLAPNVTVLGPASTELTDDNACPPAECTVILRERAYDAALLMQALTMHAFAGDPIGIERAMIMLQAQSSDAQQQTNKAISVCGRALLALVQSRRKEPSMEDGACLLVATRADIHCRGNGTTILITAAGKGFHKLVHLLLDANAKVNDTNRQHETALHLSARNGNQTVLSLLLNARAKVDEQDLNRRTALDVAAQYGHAQAARLLLDSKASVKNINGAQETPLHVAAQYGTPDVTRMLLDANANIGAKNHAQESSLHLAANNGHGDVVRLLLEASANVDDKDNDRYVFFAMKISAWHYTARRVTVEMRCCGSCWRAMRR
eukprot:GEMP01035827.1.p1 GENE.GEMP01035827.1~~GEMP01035827.1.p1  ORF type:complete len:354 (+),score=90.18 GEMP01035827.1:84-1145(+)